MGERLCAWRPKPPQVVLEHLMHLPMMFLVHRMGPTSFVIREEGAEAKRKVSIGVRPTCSCTPNAPGQGCAELCPHLLFVICKVLRVPPSNPLVWQLSLTDRELDEVLRCAVLPEAPPPPAADAKKPKASGGAEEGSVKRRPIDEEDPCPICYEDMAGRDLEHMVWCRHGCGRNVHGRCMGVWAEHQTKALGKELSCPLCRTSWGDFKWRPPPPKRRRPDETHEQLSNAAHLGTSCSVCRKGPLMGKRYRCLICADLDMCEGCFQGGHHPQHPFACKATPTAFAVPAQRPDMMPAAHRLTVLPPPAAADANGTADADAGVLSQPVTEAASGAPGAATRRHGGGRGAGAAGPPPRPRQLSPVRRDGPELLTSALSITGAPASATNTWAAPQPQQLNAATAPPLPPGRLRGLGPGAAAAAAAMARAAAAAATAAAAAVPHNPELSLAGVQASVYGVSHTGALVQGALPFLSGADASVSPVPAGAAGRGHRAAADTRARRGLAFVPPVAPPLAVAATSMAPQQQTHAARSGSGGGGSSRPAGMAAAEVGKRCRSRSATDRRPPAVHLGLPCTSTGGPALAQGEAAGPGGGLPPLLGRVLLAPLVPSGVQGWPQVEQQGTAGAAAGGLRQQQHAPHHHADAPRAGAPPGLHTVLQRHQRFVRAMSMPPPRPMHAPSPAPPDSYLTAGVQGHTLAAGGASEVTGTVDLQPPIRHGPAAGAAGGLVLGLTAIAGLPPHAPRGPGALTGRQRDEPAATFVLGGYSVAPRPWHDDSLPLAAAGPESPDAHQPNLGAWGPSGIEGEWQTVPQDAQEGVRNSWFVGSTSWDEEAPGWARGPGLGSSLGLGSVDLGAGVQSEPLPGRQSGSAAGPQPEPQADVQPEQARTQLQSLFGSGAVSTQAGLGPELELVAGGQPEMAKELGTGVEPETSAGLQVAAPAVVQPPLHVALEQFEQHYMDMLDSSPEQGSPGAMLLHMHGSATRSHAGAAEAQAQQGPGTGKEQLVGIDKEVLLVAVGRASPAVWGTAQGLEGMVGLAEGSTQEPPVQAAKAASEDGATDPDVHVAVATAAPAAVDGDVPSLPGKVWEAVHDNPAYGIMSLSLT